MAELNEFKYAEVRKQILEAVKTDLIGPTDREEVLNENPVSSYITGMLFPSDSAIEEDENYNDVEFTEKRYEDVDQNKTESVMLEDEEPEPSVTKGFKKPSSLGVSFYINESISSLKASISWGLYHVEKDDTEEKIEDSINKPEHKDKKKHSCYVREPLCDEIIIDLEKLGKSGRIPLHQNPNVFLYMIQATIANGYKMISLYLHNNDKNSNSKEYERIMFQVQLKISDPSDKPIFVPEYMCRNTELEEEFYYKNRPVYARGRGCAATWNKHEDELYAYQINSAFIPDYEISGVSTEIKGMPQNALSMLYFGMADKKENALNILNQLSSLYGDWINSVLENNPELGKSIPHTKGDEIIDNCKSANQRIMDGITLLKTNEKAYQAFLFMNQSMYLQRSITSFSKDYGKGIPCSLRDYMKDTPERGLKRDHSAWRPFQIAFILLNLRSMIDEECSDRENVDLLYFPTGGGKTEAYLGLIAFTIAYRRLTASSEDEYIKDGGVTVMLRYTLRLLTTQQRDRLLKLVIAMEMIREKHPDLYGSKDISIGFWVGGSLTPNKFSDYSDTDTYKKKDFERKVANQIIKCPYCGKKITRDNYKILPREKSVKISCSDRNCYFSERSGHYIPAYLVDEEIYGKCPTIVISTVDKFAQLPWSENVGLLFGKTDRYCPRCGYIATGADHPQRHNAKDGLDAVTVEKCKPFYPPELIIQDELHLITGPLGTIYGGYETVIEEMCSLERNGKKILPKYVVSTATIKNAKEQIKCLYSRENFTQFPPSGFDASDSYFMKEVPLSEKPFREYAGICANGQSVKTTLIRLYSIILQTAYDLSKKPEYEDYIDPYYTLVGYFNSIRELGGAVRMLDDDIKSRLQTVKKKYNSPLQRYLDYDKVKEITSRIPSWQIADVLEKLAIPFNKDKQKQECYDVVIATNMIAVGMDVDRLGLMTVVGQPKQNSEYIQATSRVGRRYPGIIFTVYNPYRPRDLSNYENFVGFHSQMYRYVEGTTATPFAARARDRFLHALVVSLVRQELDGMLKNAQAVDIVSVSDEDLEKIEKTILNRVAVVAPSAYDDTKTDLIGFIDGWKSLARSGNLYYHIIKGKDEGKKSLLEYYGNPHLPYEKPTLNSMRDVEQSSTVFYWEA